MDTIHISHAKENVQPPHGISISRSEHGVARTIKSTLIGRFASLGIALTGMVACSENVAATHCEISSPHDGTNGDAGSVNSQDSQDAGTDTKSSGVPATTMPILKHATKCFSVFEDTRNRCNDFILSRIPSDPDFCDTNFADSPQYLQDICHQKTKDCLAGVSWIKFQKCLDAIPADPTCKAILQPTSMIHDSDGDGLSDHFELFHSNTNPCEPCSYGDTAPCDAEAPYDDDGLSNKDAQNFFGGCGSKVGTDECG